MDGLIAYVLSKKYTDKVSREILDAGFKVQVEQDRSILETSGQEKILYLLPKESEDSGDGYDEYVYADSKWEWIGHTDVDLSGYQPLIDSNNKLLSDLVDDSNQSHKFVSENEKSTWSGKYDKPSGGIPKTDLSIEVQTSLGKADTALQTHQDISGKADKATTLAGYGITNAYTKAQTKEKIEDAFEVAIGSSTPDGNEVLWVDTTDDPTPPEPSANSVFGVVWNYSLSSPVLTRLTSQNDPLELVTNTPSTEPTACVGTTGGQSDFDSFMPWSGMVRKNYVLGEVVDFTSYSNGETFVYIPEFWSKIVNDTTNSRMYFYISSGELTGFTKHPGSGHYMSRYECNSDFLSAHGTTPKVNTSLTNFRTNITSIDNNHYQYDIHTYAALELLYIVEFAHLNTQSKIGAGITSGGTALTIGETDILTYHTGRVDGTADNVSAVQYRWIENLWGNVWSWIDGILIQDGLVYICNDRTKYASSITSDYESTGLYTPIKDGWYKTDQDYNNCYLIPLSVGSSDSTYTCDYFHYYARQRSLGVGGSCGNGSHAGLFYWNGGSTSRETFADVGGRAVLYITGGES